MACTSSTIGACPARGGNIDHLVIAPAGIFVVDAKHYDGLIQIRNRGWWFRPDYRLCTSVGAIDPTSPRA
jgi:hypothetical protein